MAAYLVGFIDLTSVSYLVSIDIGVGAWHGHTVRMKKKVCP